MTQLCLGLRYFRSYLHKKGKEENPDWKEYSGVADTAEHTTFASGIPEATSI